MKRPANKSRKSSALRTSFNTSHFDQDDSHDSPVVVPKRSGLSRLAMQRNAEMRPASDMPIRLPVASDDARPSYSKHHLMELKQSTPSTPRDQSFRAPQDLPGPGDLTLDLASKFGTDLSAYQLPTAIPTDAEIKEKKERRARLAKEQDFMALDGGPDGVEDEEDDDENVTRDDHGRLILKPKEEHLETRLVHDDEDIFEDFDDFTTDSRIGFGDSAVKEAARKRKAEMASLIADAEGTGDGQSDDDDDSEAERNAAFEVAQTRHGNYGTRDEHDKDFARPQTPPKISPLPTLDAVMERLRKQLETMETVRMAKTMDMQRLVQEKAIIGEEEVRVQAALKETGERYSRLRDELRAQQSEQQPQSPDSIVEQLEVSNHFSGSEGRTGLRNGENTNEQSLGLGAQ